MPWGCDILAEEFLEPVFNPQARDCAYVGAIWSDQYRGSELGNLETISLLRQSLAQHRLRLAHYTHISDAENVAAVRSSRLAPAVAGKWQREHNYLPCRVFKHPAYGALAFTNVPAFREIFGGCAVVDDSVPMVVAQALQLSRREYLELVREQQRVVARYTYRQSLEAIGRALEEGRA